MRPDIFELIAELGQCEVINNSDYPNLQIFPSALSIAQKMKGVCLENVPFTDLSNETNFSGV